LSETQVLFAVAQAFYAAAGTEELRIARKHAIEVARLTMNHARARLESGAVNRTEVTRAELALVRAEQRRSRRKMHATRRIVRSGPCSACAAHRGQDWRGCSRRGHRGSARVASEFAVLESSLAASGEQARAQALRWAPTLAGFGNLRGYNYTGFSGDQYAWALGLELDWTLYDGGGRDAERHRARAVERETTARISLLRDTVSDDIENARRTFATKGHAVVAQKDRSCSRARHSTSCVPARCRHDNAT